MNDKPLEILIIEDNVIDREAIRRYLTTPSRGQKFVFHETDMAAEGLKMLQEGTYDCVFLDYLLPDADGISVLKQVYDPATDLARNPIVMLTGQGSESVMLDALRLGAQDYILKESMSPDGLRIAMTKARELFEAKQLRRQAEEQLQHTRKMEAVGQLTSGVAHDFNNLLTVISGNTHLLRRRLNAENGAYSPADLEKKIRAIETAAEKGAELVRRLMVFSRQSALAQETVDINGCLAETLELLKRTLGDNIEIATVFEQKPWPVFVDVGEFGNMLINFAVNARDAMPRGGKLTMETHNVTLDEAYTLRHPDAEAGDFVMIAISDSGTGMSAEVKRRVFEPFFTTKPEGQGTGLGMSMAYGFVKQSGGHLLVYSEENHGTVFRVYLPKAAANTQEEEARQVISPLPADGETVLVVDDDDDVRAIAIGMLGKLGYTTLEAKSSRAAMEILRQAQGSVDLVFADIFMPGGANGVDMVEAMRGMEPGLKVLYTSGYTENAIPGNKLSQGEELLSKPYRREALAEKIRKVLGTREVKHVKKAHSGH